VRHEPAMQTSFRPDKATRHPDEQLAFVCYNLVEPPAKYP
jgi:hypothetical protein